MITDIYITIRITSIRLVVEQWTLIPVAVCSPCFSKSLYGDYIEPEAHNP